MKLLIPFLFLPVFSWAQSEIQIQTPWDEFTIKQVGGEFKIDDKTVASNHIHPLIQILSSPATAPCSGSFKGNIHIVVKSAQGRQSNTLDLQKGLLKGEKGCLLISGPGLDGFPAHRSWLIGPFERNLSPKTSLGFSSNQVKFQLVHTKDEWVLRGNNRTFNHEFFEQFRNSLRDFKIDRYIHLSALKNKPKAQLVIDGKSVSIFQVAPTTWAMSDGDKPWALISSNWSIWKDLGKNQWTDSYADGILKLISQNSSNEEKKAQIESLGGAWSESLKLAYQTCILSDNNSEEVRSLCLSRLRQRPTDSNFRAVFSLLDKTDDENLLKEAGDFLRIKNPKGPRLEKKTDPLEFKRAWRKWWVDSKL